MKRMIFLILLVGFFAVGCAGLQLENGSYPNRGMNSTLIGAAIGAAPGIVAGNKHIAIAGGLAGGAIGGWLGNRGNAEAYSESRVYREEARQEWKEVYTQLAAGASGTGTAPSVVVMIAPNNGQYYNYSGGWQSSILAQAEQGFRQRGFVVRPRRDDYNNYNYYNRERETDADFRAEVLVLDLQSSIKVTITLRSLTGKNNLDRQGTGQATYSSSYDYRYYGRGGQSLEERRESAATLAAKEAIKNVFLYNYEDALS